MRTKKPTATQRNITNINTYIQNIGKTFGVNSAEYQSITAKIYDFDIYTNAKGYIQIRNTAANRKRHQRVRSIAQKRIPVSILKRKKRNEIKQAAANGYLDDIMEGYDNIDDFFNDNDDFIQDYSEYGNNQKEIIETIYNLTRESDVDFDINRAYDDPDYLREIIEELETFENPYSADIVEADDFTVNSQTGEVYTYQEGFENDDFFD